MKALGMLEERKNDDEHDEIGQQNSISTSSPQDLWFIHGRAYDLQSFIAHHPGGSEPIRSVQGMDCTALFESYHPFTEKHRELLATFKQIELPNEVLEAHINPHNTFRQLDGSLDPFWEALRSRCGAYFRKRRWDHTMPWPVFLFYCTFLLVEGLLYYYGYLNGNKWIAWGSAIIIGILTWIGGRIAHDGLHYAISHKPWINKLFGSLGAFGLYNIPYWELLHNLLHHTNTNLEQMDPDLYHFAFLLRGSPDYPLGCLHRFQVHRIWCYLSWSLTTAGLLLVEPMFMLVTGTGTRAAWGAAPTRLTKPRPIFWCLLIVHMLAFLLLSLALPCYLHWSSSPSEESKWTITSIRFFSFVLYLSVNGLAFAFISQVSHFAEGCVEAGSKKDTRWAVRQVETAANFASHSLMWNLFAQGVNIQIEHHLFPGVSSDKLIPLIPIVKATCEEFGVEYKDFPTYCSILRSTHCYMDTLATSITSTSTATSPTSSSLSGLDLSEEETVARITIA